VAELAVSSADTLKLIRPQAVIARAKTTVTAFIGRALKGPVNQPVTLHSFEDYRRVFGGLWQPSTLSYAVEQFFEHGGTECIVARVCNGGRAPTLTLPAAGQALTLIGRAPGTREYLRAAVDYDGIDEHETDRFNLVVQRVRAPGSELVEEQESFRRLSILPDSERSVFGALAESRLVRVLGELPPVRPDTSLSHAGGAAWIPCNADGDDGDALSSYDLIGDAQQGTGLFALRGAEPFNFLYVPPLTRQDDVGLPALLVALRLCRERQSMLLLDPPLGWSDVPTTLQSLRSWPFFSEDALMFYPRVLAPDRLRGRDESFGPAAIAAGLITHATTRRPIWSAALEEGLSLRAPLRPAATLSDLDRTRLTQAGLNVLHAARTPLGPPIGLRTLLPEGGSRSDWRYASARRLALFIMSSIEQGTRWALFEPAGPALWRQLTEQVGAFLQSLADEGAFVGRSAEENYFVICDERLNAPSSAAAAPLQLLFGFAPCRPGDFVACLVQHTLTGSSVRPVSVNRYALPGPP
jgi:phage tail sheath protein FI